MTEKDDALPPGAASRRLIRAADRASLATQLGGDGVAWPYASLVLVACTTGGMPLLLLSDLADHSKNIAANPRVALLFDGTAGRADPLTGPRLTLLGWARETQDPADKARYPARHPSAELYAGFKDFRFYRVEPMRGHLVAGFGRIHWLEAQEIFASAMDEKGELAAHEREIVAHMNADHAEAVRLYARCLLGLQEGDWKMTGIDPEGLDLRAGGSVARLNFSRPLEDASSARAELARLALEARDGGAHAQSEN